MYRPSRVIKSQDVSFVSEASGMTRDFIPLNLKEKGEGTKGPSEERKKQKEIERILQQTERKIAEVQKSAYEEGFSAGVKEGSETQRNEMLTVVNTLHALTEEIRIFKEKTLEASEKQVLDLCFSIAEMVVHKEISTDQSVILGVLKEAFRNIVERENIKVRLNPVDFQYMVEIKSDFINSMDGVRNVFFEEDGSISRGGAVIETDSGEVDARISEQLHEIKSGIMNLAS
ncbi:flagellar assembly protein FliH [Syntrophus gentianae]|uniref:Flagellar assembly protein FliH n=2 Tax=Syntrophus gentianae TaxID=43775 RepID=A0A1H7VE66_9BACT|nr:flagellar assembly protein FliH [Syntrophus gentianae]